MIGLVMLLGFGAMALWLGYNLVIYATSSFQNAGGGVGGGAGAGLILSIGFAVWGFAIAFGKGRPDARPTVEDITARHAVEDPDGLETQIVDLVLAGELDEAAQIYRAAHGGTLDAAEDAVVEMAERHAA